MRDRARHQRRSASRGVTGQRPVDGVAGDIGSGSGEGFPQLIGRIRSCYVCDLSPIIYGHPMANRRNLASSFDEIRMSFQARAVLDVLAKERSANSRLLDTWLVAIGLSASRQAISDLLDRLEKEGLVRLEVVDDFKVVHLRRLGGEVASGHEIRDWIARPELPE